MRACNRCCWFVRDLLLRSSTAAASNALDSITSIDRRLQFVLLSPRTIDFRFQFFSSCCFFYLTNVGTGIALLHKLNLQDPFSEIVIQCCDTGGRWRWHWLIFSVAIAAGNWSKDLEAFVGRVHVTTCKTFSQFKITNFHSWQKVNFAYQKWEYASPFCAPTTPASDLKRKKF